MKFLTNRALILPGSDFIGGRNSQQFQVMAFLVIFMFLSITSAKSDPFDCKTVQCPPQIECPPDSIIRVLNEPPTLQTFTLQTDDGNTGENGNNYSLKKNEKANEIDNNNNRNSPSASLISRRNDNLQRRSPKFIVESSDDIPQSKNHQVSKRSLKHKRRESIKIIPGDYISLVPELISYQHNHPSLGNSNHNQHHYKWKRSIGNEKKAAVTAIPTTNENGMLNDDNLGGGLDYDDEKTINDRDNNNSNTTTSNETFIKPFTYSPRKLQDTTITLLNLDALRKQPGFQQCCYEETCVCSGQCPAPKCSQTGLIPYETGPGTGKPGRCCPSYECRLPQNCSDIVDSGFFWINKCKKCKCSIGYKLCHDACEENQNGNRPCFSTALEKPIPSGKKYKEDDCTECECNDGDAKCQVHFCKPLDCPKQVKLPGDCCRVCVAQEPTTTQTTLHIPDEDDEVTTRKTVLPEIQTDSTPTTTISTTTTPEPTTTTTIASTTTTSTTPTPTTTTTTTTEASTLTTTVTIMKVSSTNPSTSAPVATLKSNEKQKPTTMEPVTVSTIVSTQNEKRQPLQANNPVIEGRQHSPEQRIIATSAPASTTGPPECITTKTTKSTLFLPTEHFKFLETDVETIILYVIIVVLLIICCIFVGLYVHELTKRTTYSSIPSSDSNLSQMPKPKAEEA